MKKALSTTLLLLLVVFQMMASPVSRQEALTKACQFLNNRGIKASSLKESNGALLSRATGDAEDAAYYVFNVGNNGGFVIVSGDDRTDAVLGYSTSGNFDDATMPDNMRAWLQGYADQISSTRSYSRATDAIDMHDPISPLLNTRWDQDNPYNALCPEYNGKLCVTGCVATAMAQILNYYRYPKDMPAIKGYTTYSKNITVEALPEVKNFNWGALKTSYSKEEQDNDIATLMRYCGQSVLMDYTPNASNSDEEKYTTALCNVFNYASAEVADRVEYSAKRWDELIYNELSNSSPVFFGGQSSGGGHAFVCDGYDGYGYYHINWGWRGKYDGYFLLSALNPLGGGIGASTTPDGYNHRQTAVVNVKTTGESEAPTRTEVLKFEYTPDDDLLSIVFKNTKGKNSSIDVGVGYLNDNEIVCLKKEEGIDLEPFSGHYLDTYISEFNSLADGTYHIFPISKKCGSDIWLDSRNKDDVFAEIKVAEGKASFVAMHPTENFEIAMNTTATIYLNCKNKIKVIFENKDSKFLQKVLRLSFINTKTHISDREPYILHLEAEPGAVATGYLSFKPSDIGEYVLTVEDYYTKTGYVHRSVVVNDVPVTDYNNSVSNPRFEGGKKLRYVIDITNNDTFDHPSRYAYIYLKYQTNETAGEEPLKPNNDMFEVDAIPAGSTATMSFDISDTLTADWTEFLHMTGKFFSLSYPYSDNKIDDLDIEIPQTRFYAAEINPYGCASFASAEALDFSGCDDLVAYTGKVNAEQTSVVMTRREQVPANTGLVLKGTPYAKYAVKKTDSAPAITENDIIAVTEDKTIEANSALVLECIDHNIGFYNFTETYISAGHSYLPKTGDTTYMDILWDADPSAIHDVTVKQKTAPSGTFNLAGQRVGCNYKGIIIKHGKKMIKSQ